MTRFDPACPDLPPIRRSGPREPSRRAVLASGLTGGLAAGLGPGLGALLAAPAVRAAVRDGQALEQALARARPGEAIALSGPYALDRPLRVPPGVTLAGSGKARLTAARRIPALVVLEPGSGSAVRGLMLDGAGQTRHLIAGPGASFCRIEDCRGIHWRGGIVLGSNGTQGVQGLRLARVRLEAPARGAIYPVQIRSGNGGPQVRDVTVEDVSLIGAGGSYAPDNAATADQLALQGVTGFQLIRIESRDGGENGITAGRLSRDGTIRDCLIENNDGHGLNAGSGYVAVTVSSTAGIATGDRMAGPGGSRARVQTIRGDMLYLNRLALGRLAPGDVLTGPGGRWRTTVTAVTRSGDMRVTRVTARGNWQNRGYMLGQGAGLYAQQADRVFFEHCRSGDSGPVTQDWGLLYAQSDVGWRDCDLTGNRRGESRGTGRSRALPFPD